MCLVNTVYCSFSCTDTHDDIMPAAVKPLKHIRKGEKKIGMMSIQQHSGKCKPFIQVQCNESTTMQYELRKVPRISKRAKQHTHTHIRDRSQCDNDIWCACSIFIRTVRSEHVWFLGNVSLSSSSLAIVFVSHFEPLPISAVMVLLFSFTLNSRKYFRKEANKIIICLEFLCHFSILLIFDGFYI